MQDFHSIPGLAGRIFSSGSGSGSGGGGGADHRRMRGYPGGGGHEPPAKCPRCDSVNTKFCYYNNYNLSQPRHFCKSCRRYWTKGGVLRNVPVGGGCRKSSSKRSSSSSSSSAKKPSSAGKDRRRPPASRCSSDSSSLTAATTDPSAPFTSPDLFAPRASNPNTNPDFDPTGADPVAPDPDIFPEAGSFTSLMASAASVPSILGLSFSNPPPLRLPAQQPYQRAGGVAAEEEIRMPGLTAGFIDQTVPLDAPVRMNSGGIIGLDWPGSVDPGLFDLTSAVDPGTYWNLGHWGDTDPSSLYLP